MSTTLNLGNEAFRLILNSEYIDKTGLIDYMNSLIGTARPLVCFTRPPALRQVLFRQDAGRLL